jgi:hypothetical protein
LSAPLDTVDLMAVGPAGATEIRVICDTEMGHFDLRLYGADEYTLPSWWIGMSDPTGMLRRTWISNGAELTSGDLHRWLRPIVGHEVAGRLVRMALHAQAGPGPEHGLAVALR